VFSRATLASDICQSCDRGNLCDAQSRTAMALQAGLWKPVRGIVIAPALATSTSMCSGQTAWR